jgi:hypothetical protein
MAGWLTHSNTRVSESGRLSAGRNAHDGGHPQRAIADAGKDLRSDAVEDRVL